MSDFIHTLKLALFIGVSSFMFSCSSPQEKFIKHFSAFVNDVEQSADALSFSDWDALDQELNGYAEEYQAYSRDFTKEQQREVGRLFGKYYKLRLQAAGKEIDNYNGLAEGFMEEFDGVEDAIEEAADNMLENFD